MPVAFKKIGQKYRVVEKASGVVAKKNGKAVDGGGHSSKTRAIAQVQAINISTHQKKKKDKKDR